jgi:hypothetical protein
MAMRNVFSCAKAGDSEKAEAASRATIGKRLFMA